MTQTKSQKWHWQIDSQKKTKVQLAVFALDRISTESPEAAFSADYHQVRLQRIMLNEASYHMMTAGTEEARGLLLKSFVRLVKSCMVKWTRPYLQVY